MGIESQTLISLRRCTGCFARKPTIGGFHPQNVSQNLWVLEPSWNSTPQNRTVLLHVPPGIKDLKVYSATQNLRKVVLLWKLRVLGPWILHVKGLNFRNPSTRTSTIYLEAKWPLFLKVNPPKQGPFQIKTRAPIWVPGIYIYIYIYIFVHSGGRCISFFCTACGFFKVVVTRTFIRWIHHTRRWSLQRHFQTTTSHWERWEGTATLHYGRWCTKHRHALTTLMLRLGLLCTVEAAAFLFSARPVGFSRLWSPELLSGGSTTPAGGPFKDIFKPQHPTKAAKKRNNRPTCC